MGQTPTSDRTVSAQYFASRITHYQRARGVPFDVYRPQQGIDAVTKVVTALPAILIGFSVGHFLQEGTTVDEPSEVGVGMMQHVQLRWPQEDQDLIQQRDFILDNLNQCWLVTSFPDRQRYGIDDSTILGCACHLTLQVDRPPGLPPIDTADED